MLSASYTDMLALVSIWWHHDISQWCHSVSPVILWCWSNVHLPSTSFWRIQTLMTPIVLQDHHSLVAGHGTVLAKAHSGEVGIVSLTAFWLTPSDPWNGELEGLCHGIQKQTKWVVAFPTCKIHLASTTGTAYEHDILQLWNWFMMTMINCLPRFLTESPPTNVEARMVSISSATDERQLAYQPIQPWPELSNSSLVKLLTFLLNLRSLHVDNSSVGNCSTNSESAFVTLLPVLHPSKV